MVAGDPVDTHVRVRFSSTYVRDEMMGGSGEERYSNMECLNDLLLTTEAIGIQSNIEDKCVAITVRNSAGVYALV